MSDILYWLYFFVFFGFPTIIFLAFLEYWGFRKKVKLRNNDHIVYNKDDFLDMEYERKLRLDYIQLALDNGLTLYHKSPLEHYKNSNLVDAINLINEFHMVIADKDEKLIGDYQKVISAKPEKTVPVTLNLEDI